MLQRLYIHNFRCLENFELNLKGMSSALLIGKNGTGKSTIASALEVLQGIGRGINRVDELVGLKDFAHGRFDIPIRFEIEVLLNEKLYKYVLAFELLEKSKELQVFEEQLLVSGNPIYTRKVDKVNITSENYLFGIGGSFPLDWSYIALNIIRGSLGTDPLYIFKTWLAQMIILAPIPSLITGNSKNETLKLKKNVSNFAEWVSSLLSRFPAAYTDIYQYLREVMPDIREFLNETTGKDSKSMMVQFEVNNASLSVEFEDLSDGEKCFFLCAVVLAANKRYGPLFCFWDEPDNYISLSEVGYFVMSLRRSFKNSGQILVTSHNQESIRKFSTENTFILDRKSHLEPTLIRLLSDLSIPGDPINAFSRGDIEL